MAGSLSIPNTFGAASGNVPASQLDTDFSTISTYVNAREVAIGLIAARPAFGTAGRYYLATDVNGGTLYVDSGTAWVQAASGVTSVGGTLAVSGGGTGQVTLVSGSYLKGNGTSPVTLQSTPLPIADISTGTPTGTKFLRDDGVLAVPSVSAFTPSFTSSELTVTASSVISAAHGLGAVPSLVMVTIRCKTADLGYAVNDEVTMGVYPGANSGALPFFNATTAGLTMANNISIVNKATFVDGTITNGSWRVVVRAWL